MAYPDFKDYNQILSDMLADLLSKGTRLTDVNPGSIARTLCEVCALRLDECYYLAEQLLNMFFLKALTGDLLVQRVSDLITRNLGAKSTGAITASRSTPAPFSQLVPTGTVFHVKSGTVEVVSTADATLNQGDNSISIPVKAVAVGKDGNLQTGTVLQQVGVAVSLIETVTVVAPGLSGGIDNESDDALRSRYLSILQSQRGQGNISDYCKWIDEYGGIGFVLVDPLWQGPGTVQVVILDQDGNIPTPDVIASLQEYLDPGSQGLGLGKAPVGAKVTVQAPSVVNLVLTIPGLVVESGYTPEQVKTNLATAAKAHALSVSPGGVLRLKDLEAAISNAAGVLDFGDVLVNGSRQNIELAADQKAALAEVVYQ